MDVFYITSVSHSLQFCLLVLSTLTHDLKLATNHSVQMNLFHFQVTHFWMNVIDDQSLSTEFIQEMMLENPIFMRNILFLKSGEL